MTIQLRNTVSLFDKYSLVIPQGLKYHTDSSPGQRVLFITDKKESFTVSFEEDMKLMDMLPETGGEQTVRYQCCQDGKYIHLRRRSEKPIPCAFFHIELEDSGGKAYSLPGQLVVCKDYTWSDGIEPVLMELLDGIRLINKEGGVND